MKRWYVVHAYSGFEKSVAQALRDRIVRDGMEERFGDVLVPTEEVVEMRAGQKRRRAQVLPGYVLVQIETHEEAGIPRIDNESWHLVKETPRVMGFIGGTADRPLPIADSEAEAILNRVQEGVEKPRPKVLFEPGQMVRVTDGPFNDFNGVVEEVNYEKSRLRVSVLIFGRATRSNSSSARSKKPSDPAAESSHARLLNRNGLGPVSLVYVPLQACEEKPDIVRGSPLGSQQDEAAARLFSMISKRDAGTRDSRSDGEPVVERR